MSDDNGFQKMLHVVVNPTDVVRGPSFLTMMMILALGGLVAERLGFLTPSGMPPSPSSSSTTVLVEPQGTPSPVEQTIRIAVPVLPVAPVQLRPAAYDSPTSGFCVNSSPTSLVYVVAQTATALTQADGPYCTTPATCPAGATIPIAGRAWASASVGVTLSCRFVDAGNGYSAGPQASAAPGVPVGTACLLAGGAACTMTGQIRGGGGGSPTTPEYAVGGFTNRGFGSTSGVPVVTMSGTNRWVFDSTQTTFVGLLYGGVSASPTYSFGGDTGTGIGRSTSGVLDIHAGGGAPKMTLSSTVLTSAVPMRSVNGTPGTAAGYGFASSPASGLSWLTTGTGRALLSGPNVSVVTSNPTGNVSIETAPGGRVVIGSTDASLVVDDTTTNNIVVNTAGTAVMQMAAPIEFPWSSGNVFREYLRLPSSQGTSPGKPACASPITDGWRTICLDDTDDATGGVCCICMPIDAGGSVAWRRGDDYATACPL